MILTISGASPMGQVDALGESKTLDEIYQI